MRTLEDLLAELPEVTTGAMVTRELGHEGKPCPMTDKPRGDWCDKCYAIWYRLRDEK